MPVGAGDEALRRIEAGLVDDDPVLAGWFRHWDVPSGADRGNRGVTVVGGWTLLVLTVGLGSVIGGLAGVLVAGLLITVHLCRC